MSQPIIRTVKTGTFEMDCCTFGAGSRTFVMLPGLSVKSVMPSAAGIAASYGIFAESHTVYVFDRIRQVPPVYTIADMAEDTAAAMRILGISDADIFGASQGGMMGIQLALRHPELVHKLALGSSAARLDDRMKAIFTRWIEYAEQENAVMLNRDIFCHVYSDEYREQYADIFRAMEPDATPEEMYKAAVLARACYDFDVLDELNQISIPVLITGSRKDKVFTDSTSRAMAERIPDSKLRIYDGYSHAAYDEAPDHRELLWHFFTES